MARKKHRRNAWYDNSKGHARAAKKGWRSRGSSSAKWSYGRTGDNPRRRHRRTKRNRGFAIGSSLKGITSNATAAFSKSNLTKAGVALAGNLGTTYAASAIINAVPFLQGKLGKFLTFMGTAGLTGMLAKHVPFIKNYTNFWLLGGMLSGATVGLKSIAPQRFGMLDYEGGMDGLSDNVIGPLEVMNAVHSRAPFMHGISDFFNVRKASNVVPAQGGYMHGIQNYMSIPEATNAVHLDGLSDMALAEAEMIDNS